MGSKPPGISRLTPFCTDVAMDKNYIRHLVFNKVKPLEYIAIVLMEVMLWSWFSAVFLSIV